MKPGVPRLPSPWLLPKPTIPGPPLPSVIRDQWGPGDWTLALKEGVAEVKRKEDSCKSVVFYFLLGASCSFPPTKPQSTMAGADAGRVQDDPLLRGLGSLLEGWAAGGWEAPGAGGRGNSPHSGEPISAAAACAQRLAGGQKWGDRNQPHAPAPAGQAMEGQMLTPSPGGTHS